MIVCYTLFNKGCANMVLAGVFEVSGEWLVENGNNSSEKNGKTVTGWQILRRQKDQG